MQLNEEKGYASVDGSDGRPKSRDTKTIKEFPFDLNNLFSMQYSFDQLKLAIEYLARQQGEHGTLINELLNKEPGQVKVIERTETVIREQAARDGIDGPDGLRGVRDPTGFGLDGEDGPQGTPGLGKITSMQSIDLDDVNKALSPLQKQATQTQRLLGNLDATIEANQKAVEDHEKRLAKLESKGENWDDLHKQARADIDELMGKLNKMENNNKMADALSDAKMGEGSIDVILKALDEMQTKINNEMDDKLKNYATQPTLADLDLESKANNRRVVYNEGVLKDLSATTEANAEKIDSSRKKLARMQAELDSLRNNQQNSQMSHYDQPTPSAVHEDNKTSSAAEGGEGASSESINKLTKMIQRVEGNLIRRCATNEASLAKYSGLEDDIIDLKLQLAQAIKPKEPIILAEDVQVWNSSHSKLTELEKLLTQLRIEMQNLDAPKLKNDIIQLFQVTQTFITEAKVVDIKEDIRKLKTDLSDTKFDVNANSERSTRNEKHVEQLTSELRNDIGQDRKRIENNEQQIAALKKQIATLDERVKGVGRAAALGGGGGGGMASELLEGLENSVKQLREDLDNLKSQHDKDMNSTKDELDQKASKQELADLEARMMQRLQDMFDQMRLMFPEKEATKKKIGSIEKNIKNMYDMMIAKQTETPNEESGMFTKKYVGPANCASCEKNITNLLGQPVDYHVWKRLPFREPSERIARYGQGFSKILTMMRPSESQVAVDHTNPMGRNELQQAHRNFNMTQQPDYSAEKAYPTRGHTLDDAELMHGSPDKFMDHMSPTRARNPGYVTEDATTQDQTTRVGNYKSAQKIRLAKKGSVEPSPQHHNMSATIHTTYDLPNVKGAAKSKRTIN